MIALESVVADEMGGIGLDELQAVKMERVAMMAMVMGFMFDDLVNFGLFFCYRTFELRSSQSALRKPFNLCVLRALPGTACHIGFASRRDAKGRCSGKGELVYGREFILKAVYDCP